MRRSSIHPVFLVVACLCSIGLGSWGGLGRWGGVASAQDIEHARRTLARNPEAARAEAVQLLESGASTPEQLAAIHRVLAEACGRLGDEAAAVRSFTVALALDPSYRVERTASAEVRSPYMEAAGFWSSHATRLAVDVAEGEGDTVLVRAVDPGALAARVRVRARLAGGTFVELVRPTNEPVEVTLDGLALAREVEYSVSLLDEFGNRLFQRGSDQAPEVLRRQAQAPEPGPPEPPIAITPPAQADPIPFYVAAGIAGALGAGGIVGGAIMHVERESLASRWNAGNCGGTGVTRGEVCADERSALGDAEILAGVLYGVGGAALAAAAITVLLAPQDSPAEAVTARCTPGPGDLGLSCGVSF